MQTRYSVLYIVLGLACLTAAFTLVLVDRNILFMPFCFLVAAILFMHWGKRTVEYGTLVEKVLMAGAVNHVLEDEEEEEDAGAVSSSHTATIKGQS